MEQTEKMSQGPLKNIIAKQLIRKVLFAAVMVAVLLTFAAGFVSYRIETKDVLQQFKEIEKSYAQIIRTALWVDDQEAIQTVLIGICSLPGIQYAKVHSKTDAVCESGKKGFSEKWHRVFPISHVYKGETLQLGSLHVEGDTDYLYKKMIKMVIFISSAQVATIFITCCLILFLLHDTVIARVLKITSYTSTLSLESLAAPLVMPYRKQAPDELDGLADSINQMRENLHGAYVREKRVEEKLKKAHDLLEIKVEERTQSLHETVNELQDALSEVKILSGLLPICSHCKKIRDDKGYWNNLESYIQQHSDVLFSHGMCQECSDDLYGNEDWYKEMKKKKGIE